jgi:hypothetical protein
LHGINDLAVLRRDFTRAALAQPHAVRHPKLTDCSSQSTPRYKQAYLADVITKLVNGHLNSKIDELLPWAYPANSPLKAVA